MRRLLLTLAFASLSACQTVPTKPLPSAPPPPNTCEVWSRSCESQLTLSGVWAEVLDINFKPPFEDQGHAVCVFLHKDGNRWCYDPALKVFEGNYGGSFNLWTVSKDPLYLARACSTKPVRTAKFVQP